MANYESRGFQQSIASKSSADQEIISRLSKIHSETYQSINSFWREAMIDTRFYTGDKTLWDELYTDLPVYMRKGFSFNKIMRLVNMLSGYQRRNRNSIVAIPVECSDQKTADQLSKILVWANNKNKANETLSEAFHGALITGLNLLHVYIDYTDDAFSGDIKVENYGFNGFLIDPYFTKTDLSDCRYIWTRKFLDQDQVISLFPDREDEIKNIKPISQKDTYFQFLPQNYDTTICGSYSYDEFYYKYFRTATMIIDEETEQQIEYTGKKDNLNYILSINPKLKTKKVKIPTVKLAIIVNGHVFYDDLNPMKIDKYPFVPIKCYHHPELPYFSNRFQGIVRGLRDSQFINDRRQRILLDFLESNVNSGKKVMEDSLIDDRDAFKNGNGQVFFIKKDAPLGMESIQQLQAPSVPSGFMESIQLMDKNMIEISGVNEELLGSAEDDKAGILSMLRQGAGLTTQQIPFDHLDESMKVLGEIEIELIQKNFSQIKVSRILNEEPTQEFYNKNFDKYDCVVSEGINTPNQQMMAFKQGLYLKELGMPISSKFLLEMSQFQNKTEVIEDVLQQEQQQQQIAQQQQQLQMMELQARAKLADARAEADYGLGIERVSRIDENRELAIERRAQAIENISDSKLNRIKAISELEDIDLSKLQKMIDILKSIEQEETKDISMSQKKKTEDTIPTKKFLSDVEIPPPVQKKTPKNKKLE